MARAARALAILTLSLAACASAKRPADRAPTPTPSPADAGTDGAADAGADADVLPSLDALAADVRAELPSAREIARAADATRPTTVSSRERDACFRAAVVATSPVRARFEDDRDAGRGAELEAASGLVPPSGPACARRGEALRLVVSGPDAGAARAVIWQLE